LVSVYIFSNFMLCIFVMNDTFGKLKFLVRIPEFCISSLKSRLQMLINMSCRATLTLTRCGSSGYGYGQLRPVSACASLGAVGSWQSRACCAVSSVGNTGRLLLSSYQPITLYGVVAETAP